MMRSFGGNGKPFNELRLKCVHVPIDGQASVYQSNKDILVDSIGPPYFDYTNFQRLT